MRFYKQPSTAIPISIIDVIISMVSIIRGDRRKYFAEKLKPFTGKKHIFLANKGTSVFYLILKVLKERLGKSEVIIPAYTVTTLPQAITRLGLKVRLVDVDKKTLNFDLNALSKSINEDTLAVVPVHHFGFVRPLDEIRAVTKDIPLIEDICQAWGAEPKSSPISTATFWSLCRGKNFSTYQGGVLGVDDDLLAEDLEKEFESMPKPEFSFNLKRFFIIPAYALAMHPFIYNIMFSFISRLKSTHIHMDFPFFKYSVPFASLGLRMLSKFGSITKARQIIGMKLYSELKNKKDFFMPEIYPGTTCAFNHLPIIFYDPKLREETENKLLKLNIDTGRMYFKPLHMIFDLGYKKDPNLFPVAKIVADGLLTIPTHSYLRQKDINAILGVLKELK